jgi:predicted acyltransferase
VNTPVSTPVRLTSLDAFRGLTMIFLFALANLAVLWVVLYVGYRRGWFLKA